VPLAPSALTLRIRHRSVAYTGPWHRWVSVTVTKASSFSGALTRVGKVLRA
jgi:hypothetical protein